MTNKHTPPEIRQIKLTEFVKAAESEFAVSFPLDIPQLKQSIHEVGLISPLLAVFKNGAYQVVCGHRRLLACRKLGYTDITCLLLPDKPFIELFNLAIQENLSTRRFNVMEQANIICKLLNHLPSDKVISKYLPTLGLHTHHKILDKLLDIAKLKEEVRKAIVSGRLHEEAAVRLLKWPHNDQIALVNIFTHIHFSTSNQQEIISNIWEISRREDIKISDVLASSDIAGLLKDDSLGSPQKGNKLKRYLIRRRYPKLTSVENSFKKHLSKLGLPKGTSLIAPANFETSKFKLDCSLSNKEQLIKQISKLSETLQNEAWEDIFKIGTKYDS